VYLEVADAEVGDDLAFVIDDREGGDALGVEALDDDAGLLVGPGHLRRGAADVALVEGLAGDGADEVHVLRHERQQVALREHVDDVVLHVHHRQAMKSQPAAHTPPKP
jgi:hypothetical protein